MADLNNAQRAAVAERQKHRLALRQEYLKQSSNPYRFGEGGHLLDEAVLRFQAMNVSHFEHFKPTWISFKKGILFCLAPIVVFGLAMKYERDTREKQIRTGQIAYRDRRFKFI